MRVIGLDIHRVFAEAVALEDGQLTRLGRIEMRRDRLAAFARSGLWPSDDHVVVEATGNLPRRWSRSCDRTPVAW